MTAIAPDRRFQRTRWTIFVLLVAAYMTAFFHRMAPGVVAADLMAAFQATGAALGSLAAMYYYVYTAMQLPAGVLADTLGPRTSAGTGALVAGLGSILFGLATDFGTAALGRLLVGLGVSVVFVALMQSNAMWFDARRYGLVSGLTLFLGNLGSILAAGPLALVLQWYSWRSVFVAMGVFSLILALAIYLWVRNRPEEAGFPAMASPSGQAPRVIPPGHWWGNLRAVLGNRRVWPGFWVNFGVTGSLLSFAGLWGVPLLRDVHGLSRGEASLYTTATLAGFALSAFFLGGLSDRLGRRRPVILGAAGFSCLSWLALALLPWGPGLSGLALYSLLGLSAGGFVVTYAVAKEWAPLASAGMAIALVNTGLFLGAAIMQPLFGWVVDLAWQGTLLEGARRYPWWDYRNGLLLSAAFGFLALAAAWFLQETHCRNQGQNV